MNIAVGGYRKPFRGWKTQDIFYLSQMGVFPSGLGKGPDGNPIQVDGEVSPGDLFFFIQVFFNFQKDPLSKFPSALHSGLDKY